MQSPDLLDNFDDEEVTGENKRVQEDVRKNASRRHFLPTYKIGRRLVKIYDVLRNLHRSDIAIPASHNPPCRIVELVSTKYMPGSRSMEEAKEEVMDALRREEVKMILVHGGGGVGKTTLMQSINNELKDAPGHFKSVIMVTVSSNLDRKKLQDDIAGRLGLHLETNQDISIRANRLSERLKQEGSVLIILDDVWEKLDIDKLGIKCCKIVMTSRRTDICRNAQRQIHIRPLTEEESWKLFKSIAGDVVERNEVKPMAEDICKECGGLPLAIKMLASSLVGEEKAHMWKQQLNYLKIDQPHKIEGVTDSLINTLKLSYDHLEAEELKSCFLTCSLFPEDYEIHVRELTRYGLGEGFIRGGRQLTVLNECRSLIGTLKRRGLLLEVDKWKVRMHDVVRDVAISIATRDVEHGFYVKESLAEWPQQQEELEGRKRLSFIRSIFRKLPDQPRCDAEIKTLSLMEGERIEDIADGFFATMPNLSTLALAIESKTSLPSSLQCLEKLRVCMLTGGSYRFRPMVDMTNLLKLRKLVVLSLMYFRIGELPEELGELVHLKILDLTNSEIEIIRPNVLSKLQQLEELYMGRSFKQWMADGEATDDVSTRASFSELGTLEKLNVLFVEVANAEIFSQSLSTKFSERLSVFQIDQCYGVSKINMLALRHIGRLADWVNILMGKATTVIMKHFEGLAVNDVATMEYPSGPLPNLEFLFLEGGRNLKNVFSIEEDMIAEETGQQIYMIWALCPRLCNLKLKSLPQMETIISCNAQDEKLSSSPLPPGSFQNLEIVDISRCPSLLHAFSWSVAACLAQLERLRVRNCSSLVEIIGGSGDDEQPFHVFPNLKTLELRHLPMLKGMCGNDLQQPVDWSSQLKFLHIFKCPRLTSSFLRGQSETKLEDFRVDEDWFESLVWEDEHVGNEWKAKVTELIPSLFA